MDSHFICTLFDGCHDIEFVEETHNDFWANYEEVASVEGGVRNAEKNTKDTKDTKKGEGAEGRS